MLSPQIATHTFLLGHAPSLHSTCVRRSVPVFSSRGRISQAIVNAMSHLGPQKSKLSRRGTPPTSPEHAHSSANQSLALGNKALVMHLQCMYYTAMLSPSLPEIQDQCIGLMPRESKAIARDEVSPAQEEAGWRVRRIGFSLAKRVHALLHQHEQPKTIPKQGQAYHQVLYKPSHARSSPLTLESDAPPPNGT